MDLVIEEIKTFNTGLHLIGAPYWLTSAPRRLSQRAGSVVVAFATEEEASRAIRNRLYIAGISVRVEKLYKTASSTQCRKCQGFGHLDNHCKLGYSCRLCGGKHPTADHQCKTCTTKGAKCLHLVPQYANCKGAHIADDSTCETRQAVKSRLPTTIPL